MGRCPVRSIFPQALEALGKKQHLLEYVFHRFMSSVGTITNDRRFMTDKVMPLTEALDGYEIFNNMKAQKVVFEAQK